MCGGNVLNYNDNNFFLFYVNILCFFCFGDEYALDMTFIMRFPHVNVNVEKERKHIEGLNTIYYKLK